ncbi:MAG: hypothetical protein K1X92_01075 [Bacteroidia bacterium]|nr:hypothetical protein [Bacteroidia bacterium]
MNKLDIIGFLVTILIFGGCASPPPHYTFVPGFWNTEEYYISVRYDTILDRNMDSLCKLPYYSYHEWEKKDTLGNQGSKLKDSVSIYVENGGYVVIVQNNQVTFSDSLNGKRERIPYVTVKRSDSVLIIIQKKETFYIDLKEVNFVQISYDPFLSKMKYLTSHINYFCATYQ